MSKKRRCCLWIIWGLLLSAAMPSALAEVGLGVSEEMQYITGARYFEMGRYKTAATYFGFAKAQAGAEYKDVEAYLACIEAIEGITQDAEAAAERIERLAEEGFEEQKPWPAFAKGLRLEAAGDTEGAVLLYGEIAEELAIAAQRMQALTGEAGPPLSIEDTTGTVWDVQIEQVNPTKVSISWKSGANASNEINVWCDENLVFSEILRANSVTASVVPDTLCRVKISDGKSEAEGILALSKADKYKTYGYALEGTYIAFVEESEKGFYDQKRKSIRSIGREELYQTLAQNYSYGVHAHFTWKKTDQAKVLANLVLAARSPEGLLYVEDVLPFAINGSWEGAYFTMRIDDALTWFEKQDTFSYGKYIFEMYADGELLGDATLRIEE